MKNNNSKLDLYINQTNDTHIHSHTHCLTLLSWQPVTDRQLPKKYSFIERSHQHLSCLWTLRPIQTLPDKHCCPLWADTPVTAETQSHHQGYGPVFLCQDSVSGGSLVPRGPIAADEREVDKEGCRKGKRKNSVWERGANGSPSMFSLQLTRLLSLLRDCSIFVQVTLP